MIPSPTLLTSAVRRSCALFVVLVALCFAVTGCGSPAKTVAGELGEVDAIGPRLADFDGSAATDPVIGTTAPTIQGTSFDGGTVKIGPGAPTLVLFVAHWCPHCQREVPLLAGPFRTQLPPGTKVVTVSTSVSADRPNYPPSAWLKKNAWPTPIIADDAKSSAGTAFGLTGFPYFVVLDASGKVVRRASGEKTVAEVLGLLSAATTPALAG